MDLCCVLVLFCNWVSINRVFKNMRNRVNFYKIIEGFILLFIDHRPPLSFDNKGVLHKINAINVCKYRPHAASCLITQSVFSLKYALKTLIF